MKHMRQPPQLGRIIFTPNPPLLQPGPRRRIIGKRVNLYSAPETMRPDNLAEHDHVSRFFDIGGIRQAALCHLLTTYSGSRLVDA
jgi:hypothetical protein